MRNFTLSLKITLFRTKLSIDAQHLGYKGFRSPLIKSYGRTGFEISDTWKRGTVLCGIATGVLSYLWRELNLCVGALYFRSASDCPSVQIARKNGYTDRGAMEEWYHLVRNLVSITVVYLVGAQTLYWSSVAQSDLKVLLPAGMYGRTGLPISDSRKKGTILCGIQCRVRSYPWREREPSTRAL